MAIFGSGSSGSTANVEEVKTTIMKQLQQEAAVSNARQLIGVRSPYPATPQALDTGHETLYQGTMLTISQKVNEHCFDKCIPAPNSTLSSSEEGCLSTCMEKYISLWNVASRSYITRVGKESKKYGGQDIVAMNSLGAGGDA